MLHPLLNKCNLKKKRRCSCKIRKLAHKLRNDKSQLKKIMKKNISRIDKIRHTLTLCLPDLKKEYHVDSLELFGSRLRGDNRPESDVDILVSFSSTPSLLEFVRLKNYLSEILGLKVDLVMRDALRPHIGEKIMCEAEPV